MMSSKGLPHTVNAPRFAIHALRALRMPGNELFELWPRAAFLPNEHGRHRGDQSHQPKVRVASMPVPNKDDAVDNPTRRDRARPSNI